MWTVYLVLNKRSPVEANAEIDGLTVNVQIDSSQVVVHGIAAADSDKACKKAVSVANQFLNTLSYKYGTDLDLQPETYSAEHASRSGKKEVIVKPAPASIGLSVRATVVKRDASGNIIEVGDSQKLGKIDARPSDAAAYYRHAHLTDDPFGRFRDLYNVVENIADRIRTTRGLTKEALKQSYQLGDQSFLQLALDECFANNQQALIKAANNVFTLDTNQPVIPQVAGILYKAYRCQLNHSKASENKKVPFNPQDEKEVQTALPLMDLVARSLLGYEETRLA